MLINTKCANALTKGEVYTVATFDSDIFWNYKVAEVYGYGFFCTSGKNLTFEALKDVPQNIWLGAIVTAATQ